MKVLHVSTYLSRKGGAETYLLSVIPLLHERGIKQQFVYATGEPGLHEGALQIAGIGKIGFKAQKYVAQQMKDVLQKEQPDIVHVHNIENFGVLKASLSYGPTVFTSHDYRTICPANMMYYKRTQEVCDRHSGMGCFPTTLMKHCLTPRPQYASYFYPRTQWVLKNAQRFAHVITPSKSVKDRYVKAGFDKDVITVLPYFCSLEPRELPRPLPEKLTLSFIGRITENKGYKYFIEALGLLPGHIQGIMVGNFTEENRKQVEQLAQQHRCTERLILHSWASKEEIIEILDNTTVLVFPSLYAETLGIVGLEAFSRGVPVVASDVGGVRQWLVDGENGILVRPKSATQICEAVLQLISDEDRLVQMGENGISTINEGFLPDDHADKLVKLYEQVAVDNGQLVPG